MSRVAGEEEGLPLQMALVSLLLSGKAVTAPSHRSSTVLGRRAHSQRRQRPACELSDDDGGGLARTVPLQLLPAF